MWAVSNEAAGGVQCDDSNWHARSDPLLQGQQVKLKLSNSTVITPLPL